MQPNRGAVTLIINPQSDTEFGARVEELAARQFSEPAELEDALRQSYPNARVSPGVVDVIGRPRWYVYRDGRWVDPSS